MDETGLNNIETPTVFICRVNPDLVLRMLHTIN